MIISENYVELLSLFITSSLPGELYAWPSHWIYVSHTIRFFKLKSSPPLSFVTDALNLVLELCTYNDTQVDLKNRSIFYMYDGFQH